MTTLLSIDASGALIRTDLYDVRFANEGVVCATTGRLYPFHTYLIEEIATARDITRLRATECEIRSWDWIGADGAASRAVQAGQAGLHADKDTQLEAA